MEASSWVTEAEKMIRGDDTDRAAEMARWSKRSIYRVPAYIKNRHPGSDAYRPQLVSLGPFHHGSSDLVPMEAHKRRALAHRVRRSGKPLRAFAAAVGNVAEQLADAYENLEPRWKADRDRFVELMVTDGCFLLEVLRMGVDDVMMKPPQEEEEDYASNDPVFSDHGFLYLSGTLKRDMLVMENQLPLLLLHTLLTVERGTAPSGKEMNFVVLDAMWSKHPADMAAFSHDMALHVLDIYHKLIGGDNASTNPEPRQDSEMHPVMPSAVKLHEAGIHFEETDDVELQLQAISFERGVLGVPPTWFYGSIECEFLNLMAFERLHPNAAGNHVTEYVYFMDNLIDSADDVALLCAKGIVVNMLGSDQEVADLFNKVLSKEAVIGMSSKLHDVHHQVTVHCGKPWNRWRASLIHTYFSNPWVFVSLMAAVVLLVATLLQTVYTVVPFYRT